MKATLLYKLNQIARMRLFSGMKDGAIAVQIGMTQSGLSRIIALPEYIEMETQLLAGGITKLDEAVAGKQEEMKKLFGPAVPAAMRTLIETVTQRRDLRAAVSASIEILDRDPERTFTKATARSEADSPARAVPQGILATAVSQTMSINAAAHSQKDKNVN